MRARTLVVGGAIVLIGGLTALARTLSGPSVGKENASTATSTTAMSAPLASARPSAEVESLPVGPPHLAPTGGDDPELLRKSLEARKSLVKGLRLPNGITAELHPSRPSFPEGTPIELRLELRSPDGKPLVGRGDMQVVFDDGSPPRGFTEDATHPGRYTALAMPPASNGKEPVHAFVTISETGLVDAPGAVDSLDVTVTHGSPARLAAGQPIGTWTSEGLDTQVAVYASKPTAAALRATLVGENGEPLGETTSRAVLERGASTITLHFMVNGADPRARNVKLTNTTLFVGEPLEWSDFSDHPTKIRIR